MIRPLRRRHRLVFVVLALVVPPLLAAALLSRPEDPRTASVPAEPAGRILGERLQSFEGGTLRTELLRDERGFALRVELMGAESNPELLVYWDPAAAPEGPGLPPGAHLVGRLAGSAPRRMELPAIETSRGRLILYDLPRQRRVTSFELELPSSAARDAE